MINNLLPANDGSAALAPQPKRDIANPGMFFRRWLANPLQMGSVIPSSDALCRRVVRHTQRAADEAVLELGAGTGVVSRALLEGGVPPERLIVVEIVPEMADYLRDRLPGVLVIEGDARALPSLLPRHWHGRIGTEQPCFIDAIDAAVPGRGFLHYSYWPTSPLPWRRHALSVKREAWTPLNFPPASVWRYTPA